MRHELKLSLICAATLFLGLLSAAPARAADSPPVNDEAQLAQPEAKPSDTKPRQVLIAAGLGVGHPTVGLVGTLDLKTVDRFYVGLIGTGAVGDSAATFIGGRVQYRFALGNDLHLGVAGGLGWLDGSSISKDEGKTFLDDGIKPLVGASFAYQPNWFMVGMDLTVIPATMKYEDGDLYDYPDRPRDKLSAYAQLSAFVGVAF